MIPSKGLYAYFLIVCISREPTSVVVVADLELGEEHNLVMDKFFQYLRSLQITMLMKLGFHRIQTERPLLLQCKVLSCLGPRVG